MTAYELAKAALKPIFDAVPKGKFRQLFMEAKNLEIGMGMMAQLLNSLRGFFLETTGEDSPFVKKIDELVPRPENELMKSKGDK